MASTRGLTKTDQLKSMRTMRNLQYTEEQIDDMINNFADEDLGYEKTWTRVVVEKFLSKFGFYYTKRSGPDAPDLSKAYAYYEHLTLPRYFANDSDHIQRRAKRGEVEKTSLYSPLSMPAACFIEWGIGVDLYFSSLRLMGTVLLIAGLIHLPLTRYYAGDEYADGGGNKNLSLSLQGSAVCPNKSWVVCFGCDPSKLETEEEKARYALGLDGTVFVVRNDCNLDLTALWNWICLFFLMIAVGLVSKYLSARRVRFDEDKLTASNYTILVLNPPDDAYDPDEWRDFFSQFAEKQVTGVTVALNNEEMIRKLIQRRMLRKKLHMQLPKGVDMDNEDLLRASVAAVVEERERESKGCIMGCLGPILRAIGLMAPLDKVMDRYFDLTDEIKELQKKTYRVTRVFVTFETEEGQRSALTALTIGRLQRNTNYTSAVPPSALFRGEKLLTIDEAMEPDSVRWLDLSASMTTKWFWRTFNFVATAGLLMLTSFVVSSVRFSVGPQWSGYIVIGANSIIPMIVLELMNFEPHMSEGTWQTSLYLKITMYRWINTAVLYKMVTPFINTLDNNAKDVLPAIDNLFWTELYLVPILKLLDMWGNFQKHLLAPRAHTQEEMNNNFNGTPYNLGERYTDLTKVLFVCFYYSSIHPSTFFFGAAILFVQYYSDKYCLLRIWAWQPFIGGELSIFSFKYFFTLAILAFCLIATYFYAQFPYDNLCTPNEPLRNDTSGAYTVTTLNGTFQFEIDVTQDNEMVFCDQGWRSFEFVFPPAPTDQPADSFWMTPEQEDLVWIYAATAICVVCGFILTYFGGAAKDFILSFFCSVYRPDGQIQHIDYSSLPEVFGYIPQIRQPGLPFPLLACNIDHIYQGLIGWNDPNDSYDNHNLLFDVPWAGMSRTEKIQENTRGKDTIAEVTGAIRDKSTRLGLSKDVRTPIFSVAAHYPPKWMMEEMKNNN